MFKGSIVALVTPFANGKVDEKALRDLVEFHIQNKTDAISPCGTTGESPTLSHEEHKRVIQIVVEQVRKRVPVIAGTGSNATEEALELTRFAKRIGADAGLMVCPYYNKPTQEGIFRHFEKVAKEVDLPIILYNIPGRSGVNMTPETIARLSKIETIVAVKEAAGSLDQVSQIFSLCDITVVSGDDSLTLPMMSVGAKGVISVVANIAPKDVAAMTHSALEGSWDKARELHYKLLPLCKILFVETNPIPVKSAMELLGMIKGELRLPLCPMSEGNAALLKKALVDYGLLSAATLKAR
ncbi:MAG: 4-hydroxy-tetrahydrodipicolinate synthase [Candidatus Omnitrophota bacterium]